MKRLFAILVLGFLALGSFGLSASTAGAGPANCAASASNTATALDDIAGLAIPAAQVEGPSKPRASLPEAGPQYACNSSCARSCRQQYGNCPTRQCRQQYNACVRGCGC
jgi:hypothetical protein